ncbi:MAG: anhydro-N-acetylmuramic acid kinase, partial [Cyclobacteriaceae bacterium]
MKANQVLGVMSGSSLDGLDLCLAEFWFTDQWCFAIVATSTISFPEDLKVRLSTCRSLSGERLTSLDIELGNWVGDQINSFISSTGTSPTLIGSHGHTVFHQVEKGFSLQIGHPQVISSKTGIPVVGDFRQKDLQLGGQGAPLVPIGDLLLFQDKVACLNLGGIANISIKKDAHIIAGDLIPCNQVLNYLAMRLGHVYDDQGLLARQGKTHTVWKQQLSQIEFFSQPLPKSISNEWTETKFLHAIPKGETVDLLYTYTQFIASEICGVLQEHSAGLVMITGGGAYNTFLIDSMKAMLPNNFFEVPQPELIEG